MSGIKQPTKKGMRYHVFHRTWWTKNSAYPNGLEPCAGKRATITYTRTELEAQAACKQWCAKYKLGPLSDKAEYEQL